MTLVWGERPRALRKPTNWAQSKTHIHDEFLSNELVIEDVGNGVVHNDLRLVRLAGNDGELFGIGGYDRKSANTGSLGLAVLCVGHDMPERMLAPDYRRVNLKLAVGKQKRRAVARFVEGLYEVPKLFVGHFVRMAGILGSV